MIDIFDILLELIPGDRVSIDGLVFRWHYMGSSMLLMLFSLVTTAYQFVGYPIECISENIPSYFMEIYCLTTGLFIVTEKSNNGTIQTSNVPGLTEIRVQSYYQWVSFVLLLVGCSFRVPRYLWKSLENGRLESLVSTMNRPLYSEAEKNEWKKIRVDYFYSNQNNMNIYAYQYMFCEFLNLVNVLLQIMLMNYFLGGIFITYGWEVFSVLAVSQHARVDPMTLMFPKTTKCTFHSYGPSGTIMNNDAQCILPINNVNEKIVLGLWVWYGLLAISTAATILVRVPVLLSKRIRTRLLQQLMLNCHLTETREVVRLLSFGDWYVLYQVGRNVDPRIIKELVVDLHTKLHHAE